VKPYVDLDLDGPEPKLYRITCVCGLEAPPLLYEESATHSCPECGEDWEDPVDEALCEARGPEDDGDPTDGPYYEPPVGHEGWL
jgi:hypothetical protein